MLSLGEITHTQISLPYEIRHPLRCSGTEICRFRGFRKFGLHGKPFAALRHGWKNIGIRSKITKTRAAGAVKLRGVLFFANGIDKSRAA